MGLMRIDLPAGDREIVLSRKRSFEEIAGWIVCGFALALTAWMAWRKR